MAFRDATASVANGHLVKLHKFASGLQWEDQPADGPFTVGAGQITVGALDPLAAEEH
jgi:hypothetical protein